MRLLQYNLITKNAWVFLKNYFWVGSLLIQYQNGLEPDKAVDVTSEKVCHQQSSLFRFLGLVSVHLESLVIIIEMGSDLGCNNIQKHGEQAVYKTTYMTRVKRSERRPFIFIFRLNIVLHDSYQVDEIVMKIEEWKYKNFQTTMPKALAEFY